MEKVRPEEAPVLAASKARVRLSRRRSVPARTGAVHTSGLRYRVLLGPVVILHERHTEHGQVMRRGRGG